MQAGDGALQFVGLVGEQVRVLGTQAHVVTVFQGAPAFAGGEDFQGVDPVGHDQQRRIVPGLGGRGARIADQANVVAEGKGIEHRGQYADIGQYAADDQRVDVQCLEPGIEVGTVESAVAAFIDDGFIGSRGEALDDLHLPRAGAIAARAAIGGAGFARWQITAVGLVDMAGIDNGDPLLAGALEQCGGVGQHRIEVFEDETVLLLHVDDQQCVFIVHRANLIMGRTLLRPASPITTGPKHNAPQPRGYRLTSRYVDSCSGVLSELFARSRSAWPKHWRANA